MERIQSEENHAKEEMEQNFSQIDGVTGNVEYNWGKVKETLLDILNYDIGKKSGNNSSNNQLNGEKKKVKNHKRQSV